MVRSRVERPVRAAFRESAVLGVASELEGNDARHVGLERQHLKVVHELHVLREGIGNPWRCFGKLAGIAPAIVCFDHLDAPLDLPDIVEILIEARAIRGAQLPAQPHDVFRNPVENAAACLATLLSLLGRIAGAEQHVERDARVADHRERLCRRSPADRVRVDAGIVVGAATGLVEILDAELHRRHRCVLTVALRVYAMTAAFVATACVSPSPPADVENQQTVVPGWQWTVDQIDETVNQVRAGRNLQPDSWPGGARVALERVVGLIDRHEIPASFFIPSESLRLNPQMADVIQSSGRHEFAVHGWIHERNSDLPADVERELVQRAVDYLTQATGERPVGYRAPSWNFSPNTLDIIRDLGFLYDSSLMADDRPYELDAAGEPTGLIELPVEWILDDAPLVNPLGGRYSAPRDVLQVYKDEFDVAYEEGTMFLLTMHPHYIGHRSRIVILRELIDYIGAKDGVWFATHRQAAEYVKEQADIG